MLNINQTYNYICSNYSPHMHQKAKKLQGKQMPSLERKNDMEL